MKRKIKAAFLAFCIAVSLFSVSACNTATPEEEKMPSLIVGSDNYEPFNYTDSSGKPAGIDVEIATEACRRLGYRAVFRQIQWDSKDESLESGEVDCLWGSFSMNGRENAYKWAGPYMQSRQVVAVRARRNINSLSDLENMNVSAQYGSKPAEILSDGSLGFSVKNVYCFPSISEVFIAMKNGYTDACAGHETAISALIGNDLSEYRILDEPLLIADLGVAFSKDENDFPVERISEVIGEMKKDGTIKNIIKKYGLDPEKVLG